MDNYLKDYKIIEFMKQNNLTENDMKPFLMDIKIYLKNPNEYSIEWSHGLHLNKVMRKANAGIEYVFNPLFNNNITLKDLDLASNSSKINAINAIGREEDNALFLTGPNGCGKTYLAIALANEYYRVNNKKTLYITMPELVYQSLAFKDNHSIINKICSAERLIIDEIGNERISDWSRDSILLPIITKRVDKKLHTDLISNYSIEELSQRYIAKNSSDAKSVKTLISKMTSLTKLCIIDGKDYRNER